MFKVDLHTHSTLSLDGGITEAQYEKAIHQGLLDYVAITDHNTINFAIHLQKVLGEHIIVGEEIMTGAGEIIGLYLTKAVPAGLSPLETVKQIKDQGGLVYIPHPFETVRKGVHPSVLEEIADQVDIIEVYNGRAFAQNRSTQAVVWAKLNHMTGVASSDAHGFRGLGGTYTRVATMPNRNTIVELLSEGTPIVANPSLRTLLYPKYHRLRKKLRGIK